MLNYPLDCVDVLHLVEVPHIPLVIARIDFTRRIVFFSLSFLHRLFRDELSIAYSIHELNVDYAERKGENPLKNKISKRSTDFISFS